MRKKVFCLFVIPMLSLILIICCMFAVVNAKSNVSVNRITYNYQSSSLCKPLDKTVYVQGSIDMSGFEEKLSNDLLTLYANPTNGAIRILNKVTSFYWCSDVYNMDELGEFPVPVKKKMVSSFRVLYRNETGAVKEIYTTDSDVKLNLSVSDNCLICDVVTTKSKINFKYKISLNEDKVNVKLENESILELGDNKLTSISLFPYLGAAYKQTIPGYMFIPSGSGALIRYDEPSNITNAFTIPFYGTNANLTRNEEGPILSLPLYGVCQGEEQNAFLCEIKDGTGFATLTYSPSNIDANFDLIYTTFNYRETYTYQIPGSEEVLMIPEDFYKSDIELEYTILSNDCASYVGMARSYQEDLVGRNILTNLDSKSNLHIEVFGKDYENGLIFKKYHTMTKTSDILDINDELTSIIDANMFYTLRAFNKGGYSNQEVQNIKFDKGLGSLNDLTSLEAYYYYNPIVSYNSKKVYPNKVLVNLFNEKNYIKIDGAKYKFYANVKAVEKYTDKILNKYDNLCIDGLGYILYGDKNSNYTREEVLDIYNEILGSNRLPLYTPNYYMLKNTSKYLCSPLYADKFRFVSDSVPFISILLHGYIDLYSEFLNFSSNIDKDVLKCVEYGINPSYIVSKEASYKLSNSLSSNYFATTYSSVKDIIIDNYNFINNALKNVSGAFIVSRDVIDEGVVVVGYSNGIKIIVNYNSVEYVYSGVTVSATGYKVI